MARRDDRNESRIVGSATPPRDSLPPRRVMTKGEALLSGQEWGEVDVPCPFLFWPGPRFNILKCERNVYNIHEINLLTFVFVGGNIYTTREIKRDAPQAVTDRR